MTSLFVLESSIALKAAHRGDAHPRNQIRIFAVGFLDAAPARIARHIHDRRQRLMRAAHARFLSGHRKKRFDQFRIEGRAQADRLRKTGRVNRGVAVQAFFVKDYRNAEPAILEKELLNGVGQFGGLPARCVLRRRRWGGPPGRCRDRS